jgi:hypothetical protein
VSANRGTSQYRKRDLSLGRTGLEPIEHPQCLRIREIGTFRLSMFIQG